MAPELLFVTIDMSTSRANNFREHQRRKRRCPTYSFLERSASRPRHGSANHAFPGRALSKPTLLADLMRPRIFAYPDPNPDGWLFPITRLDELLPHWIQFGGQFRNRVESQDGLGYAPVNDTYDLTQLRIGVYIQPTNWLEIVGVTQDSRVFFNQHVATASPYQNIWDIREAYVRIGSSTEGWIDLVAGRQMFSFGDERVIGPSDWLNMGRTFDTVRVDLHHPGVEVSIFAASVINAIDGQIDHHIEGNNIYGIYSSFTHLLRHTTIEPYLLWRVAPSRRPA